VDITPGTLSHAGSAEIIRYALEHLSATLNA
jgi:hypothetical protein